MSASAAKVDNTGPTKETLSRVLKGFNIVNSLFLAATGVFTFMPASGVTLTPATVLSACYVITFSTMLLCFECHLGCLDAIIYRNCGFMFNWGGRLIFLFLNGVLAFGLGIMGIVAGSFTGLVIMINTFVLCRYRDFGEEYEREFAHMRDQAAGQSKPRANDTPLQSVNTGGAAHSAYNAPSAGGSAYSGSGLAGALADAAVRNPEAAVAVGNAAVSAATNPAVQSAAAGAVHSLDRNPFVDASAPASSGKSDMTEANGWKKYLDDTSGKYYFYNERTKETRWDTD